MAERMTGLSIDHLFEGNHNHPDIPRFIEGFSNALYSGDGKKPAALAELGVDTDFPIRILLGVPKKDLTRTQRILTEAYCSLFFGRPLGDTAGLWTARPGWKPANPNRQAAAIDASVLDVDWMLGLGIGRSVWEKSVLASPNVLSRQANSSGNIRHLLMLSVFGFSDPYQFFTAADADGNGGTNLN